MPHSFFAMLGRMKYINRWGLMRSVGRENISEHTLDVAYITHALCSIRNRSFGENLDCGKAVLYAMYHDCTEILTGDMPTPVKYKNEVLTEAYKEVEHQAAGRLLSRLPGELLPDFEPWFTIDPEYAPIVKAADKLSALIKCIEERKMGNCEFDRAYETTLKALSRMNLPEVEIFVRDFIPAYSLTLDEL